MFLDDERRDPKECLAAGTVREAALAELIPLLDWMDAKRDSERLAG